MITAVTSARLFASLHPWSRCHDHRSRALLEHVAGRPAVPADVRANIGAPERRLWSTDGARRSLAAALALIDRARSPRLFYGLLLSPDPASEDGPGDLDLQELTDQTLRALGRRLGRPLPWVAAEEHEHGRGRHVHALAVCPRRLGIPDLTVLGETATSVASEQRRSRDALLGGAAVHSLKLA